MADDPDERAPADKHRVSKLDIQAGNLRFSGEGDPAWLAEQLQKVMEVLAASADVDQTNSQNTSNESERQFTTSLASYVRSKGADGNQVLRFLVTADWLRRRGAILSTSNVAKALMDNQQRRLANPSDCLNKNIAKGFCEKTKDGFFITPEGLRELGE